jgi:hypothetical protein
VNVRDIVDLTLENLKVEKMEQNNDNGEAVRVQNVKKEMILENGERKEIKLENAVKKEIKLEKQKNEVKVKREKRKENDVDNTRTKEKKKQKTVEVESNEIVEVESNEYEVEEILQMHWLNDREAYFQVKWLGYNEITWEPRGNLFCNKMLKKYLKNEGLPDSAIKKIMKMKP